MNVLDTMQMMPMTDLDRAIAAEKSVNVQKQYEIMHHVPVYKKHQALHMTG